MFKYLMWRLYRKLRKQKATEWKRDLPFDDLIFDRWERARNLGFGEGTSMYHTCYVFGNVRVGKRCWIGPFTILDGSGGLLIGDHCSIASGAQIYSHETVTHALDESKPYTYAPVTIGDHCYIGPNSIITKGVTIGHHSIVGAGTFINKSIPPHSKVHNGQR